MFGDVIEVAIGVMLVYLLISLVCTVIMEFLAARVRLRPKFFEDGILNMFDAKSELKSGPGLGAWVTDVYDWINKTLQDLKAKAAIEEKPATRTWLWRLAATTLLRSVKKSADAWRWFYKNFAWLAAILSFLPSLVLWLLGLVIWVLKVTTWIVTGSSPYGKSAYRPTTPNADTPDAARELLQHPLVRSFMRDGRLPSYIPSNILSKALVDQLLGSRFVAGNGGSPTSYQAKIDEGVHHLSRTAPISDARAALEAFFSGSRQEVDARLQSLRDRSVLRELSGLREPNAVQRLSDSAVRVYFEALLTDGTANVLRQRLATLPLSNYKLEVLALLNQAPVAFLVEQLRNEELRKAVRSLLEAVGDDIDGARVEIERWFDQGWGRTRGWYKRRAQAIIVLIAIPIIVALNADTLTIADSLWQNNATTTVAAELVERINAETAQQPAAKERAKEFAQDIATEVRKSGSPLDILSWRARSDDNDPRGPPQVTPLKELDVGGWLWKLFGLALTLAAVSQGSDFWFQTLNKFVNIRSGGAPETPAKPESG